MNWKELEPQVIELRKKQIETMTLLEQLGAKNDKLPSVPESYRKTKALLKTNQYNVVVCGEVKKGKSSLLNAIIGRNLLPVNNEIATSQVFRITNSKEESFYLMFSDGTRKQITKEGLYRYGSQTAADQNGDPIFKDRTLSFIQVNTPVTFLPEGVSLVDTPGLGALYATHEHITNNYISQANAVIFVLDPEHPITTQEKKFILKALQVTKQIIYVMTKIDNFTPETWSLQLKRNQKLLEDIYLPLNIPAPQILPISSKSLMDAANEQDKFFSEISLKSSKFELMKNCLIHTIFTGVGKLRAQQAQNEMANMFNKYYAIINDMMKVCATDGQAQQLKINQRKQEQQKKLQEDWGEQSQQRQKILEEVQAISNSLNGRVAQIINQVKTEVLDVVNEYNTMEQIKTANENLTKAVYDEVSSRWQSATRDITDRVAEVLSRVNTSIDRATAASIEYDGSTISQYEMTFTDKMNVWRGGFFVGSMGVTLGSTLGVFSIPVVGPIAGVALALAALFTSSEQNETMQVNQNKRIISNHITSLLNELNSKLVHVQPGEVYSEVGKFQHEILDNAKAAINKYYADYKAQLEKEMKDLEAQAKADLAKRQQDSAMWTGFNTELKQIANAFNKQKSLLTEIITESKKA